MGFVRDDGKAGGGEEILRDGTPQVPDRRQRAALLAFYERFGIQPQFRPQRAQEACGRFHAHRGLEERPVERLAQGAAIFAVEADIGIGIRQVPDLGQRGAEREFKVDLGPQPLDQTADLGKVRRHVEHAIGGTDDIDARPLAVLALARAVLAAKFGPQPQQRTVGALPLVLINGARQKPLEVGSLRGQPPADHLGDGAGDDHRGPCGIERLARSRQRLLGPVLAQFLFGQAGDADRQLVRRQRVGIMQHRCHGQILAAHRPVDHHLEPLDGAERIDRAPIAACPVVILHQHQTASAIGAAGAKKSRIAFKIGRAHV